MKLPASFLLAVLCIGASFVASAAEESKAASIIVAQATQPATGGAVPRAEKAPAEPAPQIAAKPKVDPAKGDTLFAATPPNSQSCASCHNADGNSAIAANPKLAQQHPVYVAKQLREFKSGARKSSIMKPYASALSEEDMGNVAAYVASKEIKPGFAKDKDTVALGERIWRGGIMERGVPACAGCHSPNGAGIPVQYPRLGGQHSEYTSAQLTAFRDGVRTNSVQMNGVAARLNDREIKALADYIAGLR
ncbi:MAG: c-type cytochrome [Variovorax sp.]